MKHLLFFTFIVILFCGCTKTEDEKAQTLLAQIDSLYNKGKYSAALDSITQLRERFPKAVEARKHALKVWQDASLKMAQDDVAKPTFCCKRQRASCRQRPTATVVTCSA